MNRHKMIFYDQDSTAGSTGETSSAPAPAAAPAATGGIPRPVRTNVSSLLAKAPNATKAPVSGEVPKNEPENIVSGPGAGKQPPMADPKEQAPTGDAPDNSGEVSETKPSDDGKITIGDLSYSKEEWAQYAKDYANDTNWRAKNTQKSQIINKFSDDIINQIAPYALGQKEMPADLKEKLVSDIGKMQFTVKDPDGYDIQISGKDIPEEVINAIKQNVITNTFPDYMQTKEQFGHVQEELEQTKTRVSRSEVESGIKQSLEFMGGNPEFAITVRQGEKLSDVLAGVFQAGETHPEFHNAQRFAVLAKSIQDGFYQNFDQAYKSMFGKEIQRKNANNQVIANQAEGSPEVPGLSPSKGSPILERIKARNNKVARYNEMNR